MLVTSLHQEATGLYGSPQQIHFFSPSTEIDFHGNQTKSEHSGETEFVKQGVAKTTREVRGEAFVSGLY